MKLADFDVRYVSAKGDDIEQAIEKKTDLIADHAGPDKSSRTRQKEDHSSSREGGRKGSAHRSAGSRSRAAKKAARTRKRRAA